MSDRPVPDECLLHPELEQLLATCSAAELRGVVNILLRRSYSLRIDDIQAAVRTARQCECWRRARVAWERYEICRASGLAAQAIRDALGRMQPTFICAEPAVTFLVSRSNTEDGRRLNRFIHTEVLPALRKTGKYAIHVDPAPAAAPPPPPVLPSRLVPIARYAELLEAEVEVLKQRLATPPAPPTPPTPPPAAPARVLKVTAAEVATVLELFNAGRSKGAIARATGRSTRTVGRIIDRATRADAAPQMALRLLALADDA